MNNVLHIALHKTAENEPFSSQNGKFLFHIFWDKNHIGKSNKKSIEKANKVGFMRLKAVFIDNLRVSKTAILQFKNKKLIIFIKNINITLLLSIFLIIIFQDKTHTIYCQFLLLECHFFYTNLYPLFLWIFHKQIQNHYNKGYMVTYPLTFYPFF